MSHPLHVDFVPHEALNLEGAIGICGAPGRANAQTGPRDLDADLERLIGFYHVDVLVTLLERGEYVSDEFESLGIPDLLSRSQEKGLHTEWWAMPDGGVPVSIDQLLAVVERVLQEVRAGNVVVIHCLDGLGRAGLVAGASLVALGASCSEALEIVRSIRPGVLESPSQRQCLIAFDTTWRRRALERAEPGDISDLFRAPAAAPSDRGSGEGWKTSSPGHCPISMSGAATLRFEGVDEQAASKGVSAGTLRPGDVFYLMPGTCLTVGRGPECDISIASSQLSRVHAMLAFVPATEQQLVLADLDSRNGTWVDDREAAVSLLAPGHSFALARAFRFTFESIG